MQSSSFFSEEFLVSEQESALRIDKLLAERFPEHSRTYFQFLLEEGAVLCNGKRLKKREKPSLGDEIEVCFILTPEIALEPENIPLEILYEDEHLLAVNKPAGMVVHPAPGHKEHTFVHALLFHCKELPPSSHPLRPGIVHRLDKDTSGILLAAKTGEAHQKLVSLFCQRELKKHYLAICIGSPPEGTISLPIKRHPTKRQEMTTCTEGGKEAITICRLLQRQDPLSFLEIELITGRTHQIRVHLKHHKTPILGDPLYGNTAFNKKYNLHRQLLHAHRLEFIHPITGKPLQLTAPIPQDMRSFFSHSL